MRHRPTNGGGPAITAILGNNAQVTTQSVSATLPHIKAGKLRPLAVFSATRSKELPDVPTLTELGYPQVDLDGWFGVAGPAGLPEPVVQALHGKLASVLKAPDLNDRLQDQGWIIDPITPQAFRDLIKSDIMRLGTLLKDAN